LSALMIATSLGNFFRGPALAIYKVLAGQGVAALGRRAAKPYEDRAASA
jgi:hypothetical protein